MLKHCKSLGRFPTASGNDRNATRCCLNEPAKCAVLGYLISAGLRLLQRYLNIFLRVQVLITSITYQTLPFQQQWIKHASIGCPQTRRPCLIQATWCLTHHDIGQKIGKRTTVLCVIRVSSVTRIYMGLGCALDCIYNGYHRFWRTTYYGRTAQRWCVLTRFSTLHYG